MPNLIDQSFFVLDINIPNTNTAPVLNALNGFINKYEPKCLKGILGYELYKALMDNPTEQRMKDLIEGVEYTTISGSKKEWEGLVHDNLSLIADYVYYQYQYDNATQTTGLGQITVKSSETLYYTSPATKILGAWNSFSRQTKELLNFLWSNKEVYPEMSYEQFSIASDFSEPDNEFF